MTGEQEGYNSFRIAVPEAFEEVFSHFYFAENKSDRTITKTLLPSYQTILVFNFGTRALLHTELDSEIILEKCLVLGPIKRAFDYSLPPRSEILSINFKDDAFYRFFGSAPLAANLPVNPDGLLAENCFTALWSVLDKLNDINKRINYILEFCRPYLRERDEISRKLTKLKDERLDPVKYIAGKHNQSERNIQIKHKKYLGYSAKELRRYQRFLKAVELIQSIASEQRKIDWFEIISECGYYDQSQLIHDFKHYINLSPANYLKFQQDICIAKP